MSEIKNKTSDVQNVVIIGSGPAGYSAAIYLARANLKPMLISGYDEGGQLMTTTDVENYPGYADVIQGPFLMEQMKKQSLHVGTEIINDYVNEVDFSSKPFTIKCDSGSIYKAKSVIICTGAQAKWLGIESETEYRGFGVSGCATCDGFFFRNKTVGVVGGGNTAVEEALFLTNHASKVFLIHRKDTLKSEKVLQERLFKNNKIEILWNNEINKILGTSDPKKVTSVDLKSTKDGSIKNIPLDGLFIAIGHKPSTDVFKNKIKIDNDGYIAVNGTKTSVEGVFAAGDVADKIYRQAVTSAGSGCMAALDVIKYLES